MKIITDTGALLSPKEGEKIGVDVLPLNVIADKKSYKEYVDVTSQELSKKDMYLVHHSLLLVKQWNYLKNIQRKTFWLLIWLMDYQEHTKVQ